MYFVALNNPEKTRPIKLLGYVTLPTVLENISWVSEPRAPLKNMAVVALTKNAILIAVEAPSLETGCGNAILLDLDPEECQSYGRKIDMG